MQQRGPCYMLKSRIPVIMQFFLFYVQEYSWIKVLLGCPVGPHTLSLLPL